MKNVSKNISDQRGFTLIEVLLVVSILGILAAVAVPKFDNAKALANTAKIQSDMQTIDSAIVMYEMENGTPPSAANNLKALSGYIDPNIAPPTSGKCFLKGSESTDAQNIPGTAYTLALDSNSSQIRAHLGTYTVASFGKSGN